MKEVQRKITILDKVFCILITNDLFIWNVIIIKDNKMVNFIITHFTMVSKLKNFIDKAKKREFGDT